MSSELEPATSSEQMPRTVRATSSGAEPVYVGMKSSAELAPSSSLTDLVDCTEGPLAPDWDAWAEILAFGAPLAGRTAYHGFRRLQPGESAVSNGAGWALHHEDWAWANIEPEPELHPVSLTDEVLTGLGRQLRNLTGPVNPMLSGGRDSRLLTAMMLKERTATGQGVDEITAWTTSSDIGTSMEELVASKVAGTLGVRHHIVPARNEDFPRDVEDYARAVDYMASFHIWLMPVARRLASHPGTILDGLGGGVFLGGGFPDEPGLDGTTVSSARIVESRFNRLARYLEAADDIFAPGVAENLRERAWSDFEPVASAFADHPNGATLTAYLTRTLPGISLAPTKVLGSAQAVCMPILGDDVVAAALRVENSAKHEGVWYRDLLTKADPRLSDMATAAEMSKRRQHVRRGASRESASWYRDLLINGPAAMLLSDRLHHADISHWQNQLAKTKPQHLLRGLAILTLWLKEYGDRLSSVEIPFGEGF